MGDAEAADALQAVDADAGMNFRGASDKVNDIIMLTDGADEKIVEAVAVEIADGGNGEQRRRRISP